MNRESIDSEYSLIGGLLKDNSKYQEVDLNPEDFSDSNLGILYSGIQHLIDERKPADPVTVSDHLHAQTGKNWLVYIRKVFEATGSTYNVAAYAKIIKRTAEQRHAESIAVRLQNEIWTNENVLDDVMGELLSLNRGRKSFECSLGDAVNVAVEYLDEIQHRKQGTLTGITTGLDELDEMSGGFHKTDFICVGGRPAMGKTAFMLNCCEKAPNSVGIISGEQGRNQIAQRMMIINGKINSYRMRLGKLDEQDWKEIIESAARLRKMKGWLYDKPMPTIGEISRQARRWKFHYNIDALWIDYIQRVKGDKKKKRHEQVEEIAQTFKSLAVELDIPVIALAQINRDVEKRQDKRPFMSDFKDSGAIEQESDVMITLYRDEIYYPQSTDQGIAEIRTLKCRHAPTGLVKADWVGKFMRFENQKTDAGYVDDVP